MTAISLDFAVPAEGTYDAGVSSISLSSRSGRVLAVVKYRLSTDPPFHVSDFLALDDVQHGTDVVRGRSRLRTLAASAGLDPSKIAQANDLKKLEGTPVRVTIRIDDDDGVPIPKVVAVAAIESDKLPEGGDAIRSTQD